MSNEIKNNNQDRQQAWSKILDLLQQLDFWYDQRNNLMHSANGISPDRLKEVFNNRMQNIDNPEKKQQYSFACPPNEIVNIMKNILNSDLGLIHCNTKKFVGNNAEYYIYSEVKKWAIDKLFTEA